MSNTKHSKGRGTLPAKKGTTTQAKGLAPKAAPSTTQAKTSSAQRSQGQKGDIETDAFSQIVQALNPLVPEARLRAMGYVINAAKYSDAEGAAVSKIFTALKPLQQNQRTRVLSYVGTRFEMGEQTAQITEALAGETAETGNTGETGDTGRTESREQQGEYTPERSLAHSAG